MFRVLVLFVVTLCCDTVLSCEYATELCVNRRCAMNPRYCEPEWCCDSCFLSGWSGKMWGENVRNFCGWRSDNGVNIKLHVCPSNWPLSLEGRPSFFGFKKSFFKLLHNDVSFSFNKKARFHLYIPVKIFLLSERVESKHKISFRHF